MPAIALSQNGTTYRVKTIATKKHLDATHVVFGDEYIELGDVKTTGNDRHYRLNIENPHFVFTKNGVHKIPVNYDFRTKSGRRVFRHQSLPGAVIEYVDFADNQTKSFLVLDTVYRALRNTSWMDSLIYTAGDVDDRQIWRATGVCYPQTNVNGNSWLNGTGAGWPVLSDEEHYALWSNCWDVNTATHNTVATYNYGNNNSNAVPYAAQHCYNTIINGARCQLPNIQQMRIIVIEAPYIDALDPTLDDSYNGMSLTGRVEDGANSPFSFGERMFAAGHYRFYSSTATEGIYVSGWDRHCGAVLSVANSSRMSYMNFIYKAGDENAYLGGVAPILEM